MSLAPLSRFRGSCVTTAHSHQCCIFQSYAKTVPSRLKLTMKLTMHEPTFMGSMTMDTWSRRVTSDFNSIIITVILICIIFLWYLWQYDQTIVTSYIRWSIFLMFLKVFSNISTSVNYEIKMFFYILELKPVWTEDGAHGLVNLKAKGCWNMSKIK